MFGFSSWEFYLNLEAVRKAIVETRVTCTMKSKIHEEKTASCKWINRFGREAFHGPAKIARPRKNR